MKSLLVLSAALAAASASQQTLDCPLRQIAVDYAQKLQPYRPIEAFQEVADALNGAEEAQNCNVGPSGVNRLLRGSQPASRVLSYPLPTTGDVLYVDPSPATGSDFVGDGSAAKPYGTLQMALKALRARRMAAGVSAADAPQATLVLRKGTFHLSETLHLSREDSHVTFQAYPGEQVFISGAVPLSGLQWQLTGPPPRNLWEYRTGSLSAGFDAAPEGTYTVAQAQTFCASVPTCMGFSYNSSDPNPSSPVLMSFKYNLFYVPGTSGSSTYAINRGYLPGAANMYMADLSGVTLTEDIQALRVNGVRAVRARYPNVPTVELLGAMQIIADSWTAQPMPPVANYTFSPATPVRNDSAPDGHGEPYFSRFKLGVGGPCAQRFTPQAAYWCAEDTQGGGPGPYEAPVGMKVSTKSNSLPHTPYTGDVSRAVVHSWRAGRWFSWAFLVDNQSYDAGTGETTFNFSLSVGGNQGSRGGNAGQEFFIENVLDELDNPGEFFYDMTNKKLYLWYNATAGTVPPDGSITAPQLNVLINATGTQAAPVVGIGFMGIGFRDTAPFFLGPHGTPSGGDWAVERSGALFFEGTVGTTIQGCYLTTLDGNGIFFSGYNRNASVVQSELYSIGETAISQWGYTDGSPVPGMGFDATAGNQPRGTLISSNLVHEVGIFTKQNSFYFQSESFGNIIDSNIAYNGPRAGVNFDDGMGGGSVVSRNVLFNFCRESSDHGPFNSWNRQVYLVDGPDGTPTVMKQNDTITLNWILANYHSSMAIDNDDGSAFYDTHHNVFISASTGAAYGGNSLKSDFGGHANYHHDNLDLFWSKGFGICNQIDPYADGYYNNVLYMGQDGAYGSGQTCSGAGTTIVANNTVYSPTGAVQECGMTLAQWQAKGGDPGTTAAAYPADSVILGIARNILGL